MIDSMTKYRVASDEDFQGRVLILAVGHAQGLMNEYPPGDPLGDIRLQRLQAKAAELLNSPDQFKERLALSVVSLLVDEAFGEEGIEDIDLELAIPDAFDALAGVTP